MEKYINLQCSVFEEIFKSFPLRTIFKKCYIFKVR